MAGKKRYSRKKAAQKAAQTRRRNQAKRNAAARARGRERDAELRRIEKLLGEDFESLKQAREALAEEVAIPDPEDVDVESLDQWESYYDQWDEADYDFEDRGEFDGGVET